MDNWTSEFNQLSPLQSSYHLDLIEGGRGLSLLTQCYIGYCCVESFVNHMASIVNPLCQTPFIPQSVGKSDLFLLLCEPFWVQSAISQSPSVKSRLI